MGRSGIFEIIADTVRRIMKDVDRGLFMKYLQTLGLVLEEYIGLQIIVMQNITGNHKQNLRICCLNIILQI